MIQNDLEFKATQERITGDDERIISVRKPKAKEVRAYEKGI